MAIRASLPAILAALLLAGCTAQERGPIAMDAIGGPPRLVNPNLQPLDPPSAYLAEAVAQGLVRFDANGEIEPALAQSWIVSDDGRRYTFRLRRAHWANGSPVTAEQVAARLRAAFSRASRNPLKPVLGAVEDVVAMTDFVLEISLRGPRPNFLQLLAHPEMALILDGQGTGPYRIESSEGGVVRLSLPGADEEEAGENPEEPANAILLRGARTAIAVARFANGDSDFVTGGTAGDLPIARAAEVPSGRLAFDPVSGLFGLAFVRNEGPFADRTIRQALAMAVDRQAIAVAIGAPQLAPRTGIVPSGVQELASPSEPEWAALDLAERRARAREAIAAAMPDAEAPIPVRVAMPAGPGYRLIFAHLRRDWRAIGVEAEAVAPNAAADLRFVDMVAPSNLPSWYLRHFVCEASRVCDPAADAALLAAREATSTAERQARFAAADRLLTQLTPFIALTAPVRWSLVSQRLTNFRPNPFARHPVGELIAARD